METSEKARNVILKKHFDQKIAKRKGNEFHALEKKSKWFLNCIKTKLHKRKHEDQKSFIEATLRITIYYYIL